MSTLQEKITEEYRKEINLPVLQTFLQERFPNCHQPKLILHEDDSDDLLITSTKPKITIVTSKNDISNHVKYIGAIHHQDNYALFAYQNSIENPQQRPKINHYHIIQNTKETTLDNLPYDNPFQKLPYYKAIKHMKKLLKIEKNGIIP